MSENSDVVPKREVGQARPDPTSFYFQRQKTHSGGPFLVHFAVFRNALSKRRYCLRAGARRIESVHDFRAAVKAGSDLALRDFTNGLSGRGDLRSRDEFSSAPDGVDKGETLAGNTDADIVIVHYVAIQANARNMPCRNQMG